MELHEVGQLPLSPMACGIHDPDVNELLPSSARNSTVNEREREMSVKSICQRQNMPQISLIKINFKQTCKHVTLAQKNGANLPLQRCP